MFKQFRGLLLGLCLGIFCTALIVTLTTTAFGATGEKTIDVWYGNIKILLYGQPIETKDANGNTVEPFIYNGTTYVPIRAVSEALDKAVVWDKEKNAVLIKEKTISQRLDGIKYTTLANGRIAIDTDEYFKDKTTNEIWDKMKMQVYYAYAAGQEQYLVFKDGAFRPLPGRYVFDGGVAQFCVSDLDNDGEYELLSVFHAGSGMDYQLLDCYMPNNNAYSTFGTANNRYKLVKTDDQNVFIEFSTGEKAAVNLVKSNNEYNLVIDIPANLSEEMEKTILTESPFQQ